MEVDSVEARALSSHFGQSLSIEEDAISELKIWNRDNDIPDLYNWQEQALLKALKFKTSIVCVPTGGGKSLVYSLLPKAYEFYMPRKTGCLITHMFVVIIISPLIQLINDQVRAAKRRGISMHYVMPSPDSCSDQRKSVGRKLRGDGNSTPLLFICCPETFNADFFQDWLKSKLNFVHAIVLDEVHQVLACTSSFREDYGNIFDYIPINLPILLLSGSLTIRLEKELVVNKIANRAGESISILKEPMDRPNIFHLVKTIEEKKTFAEELHWIVLLMKLYEDDVINFPFIIIYFQSIETLSNVFAWLVNKAPASFKTRLLKFYSNIADEEFRSEATADFMKDTKDNIACPYSIALSTSALGQGVDKRHVRIVVQWEAPADIEAYIQAAGRGGRDPNEQAISILYERLNRIESEELLSNQMKTFMLSGEFIRCRRERLWREFETSACFTRSMTVTKCCDLCYLASLNDPEDSPPPPLEHAIRLICPNFKISMENAINASTLLPMAITLKELGIKSSGYKRSSNEKKIFEAKVAEIVKSLGELYNGPLAASCYFISKIQLGNIVKIGFYLDDDFKREREGRGLYYLSRAVNVGILKIPEEQLCHLHTEIIAAVRSILKSREDQEEAETQEIPYEEEEVEGIVQLENIIDIHNAEDESLLQRFSQTIMQKNKNKK